MHRFILKAVALLTIAAVLATPSSAADEAVSPAQKQLIETQLDRRFERLARELHEQLEVMHERIEHRLERDRFDDDDHDHDDRDWEDDDDRHHPEPNHRPRPEVLPADLLLTFALMSEGKVKHQIVLPCNTSHFELAMEQGAKGSGFHFRVEGELRPASPHSGGRRDDDVMHVQYRAAVEHHGEDDDTHASFHFAGGVRAELDKTVALAILGEGALQLTITHRD